MERRSCCGSRITARVCAWMRFVGRHPAGGSLSRGTGLNRSMGNASLWFFAASPLAARRRGSPCHSENTLTIQKGRMPHFKVLIVDDEPISRRRLRRLLAFEPDCEVAGECGTGVEAVQCLEREKIDILFLDVQMPEMDGFEVANAVSTSHPLILFTSAYDVY